MNFAFLTGSTCRHCTQQGQLTKNSVERNSIYARKYEGSRRKAGLKVHHEMELEI